MEFSYFTLNDIQHRNKTVLLRLDINSPLDPDNNQILDDSRMVAAKPALDALSDSKIVVLAHQSRPGKKDFTSLEQHVILLQKVCVQPVKFVDDIIGPTARAAIKELKDGEVLVLDNVRLCSEELLEDDGRKLAKTNLVSRLAPLFDLYVNDAFASVHRAQTSLVGFPYVLPSAAGKLMERELNALKRLVREPQKPSTYILGGAKIEDKVPVIENILATGGATHVLVGGNVGKVFLKAAGFAFDKDDESWLMKNNEQILKAKQILQSHTDQIRMPSDFGVLTDGQRRDVNVKQLAGTGAALDIGAETVDDFAHIIRQSKTIVASGPMGVFEQNQFETGTKTILEEMARTDAFTVIGGGHLAGYASILKITSKFSHVSTAGGAMLSLLAGESLPAIVALEDSARLHGKK